MTNLMIRIVTLATCSIALIAAFSVTPVVAVGSDPGGGEANYGGVNQRSAYPPSSYPKRSGTKATHAPKAKKAKQSLFDDPAFAHGYRAAHATIYDRNDYAGAIEQRNRDQAQYHLSRIAAICGTGCEEYRTLAAALEKPPGTGLVY